MNEDPYESITKECQITIYQEQKLRKCRFAFEPEQEEQAPSCPVQVTGITMESPPESDTEHVEEETFHTPPEQHQSRSVSSCDNPGPEIRPGNNQVGRKSDGDGFVEDVVCDHDKSKAEVDLKRKKVDSQFMSGNDCLGLGETEPIVIGSEDVVITETEVVDLSVEDNCDEMGERVTKETENVVEHAECRTSRGRLGRKSIEGLDAFRYVSSGGVGTHGPRKGVSRRRELPNSFKERQENEGLWVPRRSPRDNETFKGLVDAAGIVGGDSTNTDYSKAAMERGLIFYQPRWCPREGFDDQVMD